MHKPCYCTGKMYVKIR